MNKKAAVKKRCAFLGVAIVVLALIVLPYAIRGRYLVLADDAVTQHATFLEYMFRHGIFGGAGGYDYSIGLGADYMVSFSYYMIFDPVNLLLYILPRSDFLLSYSVLVCVKFLLTAVFMYEYLQSHKVRQTLAVIFSVAYMLGGYMLFTYVRHPDLCAGAIYLPLVTLGLEKTVDGKTPYVLVASVFVTAISSFYMLYMVTLFAVLYAALYYSYGVKRKGEKITAKGFAAAAVRTGGYYILGLLLAAFLLFPVAYGYISGARSGGKGFDFYGAVDLLSITASFVLPITGTHYTPVMLNAVTLVLTLSAFAVTRKSAMKTASVIFALCTVIPLAGYAANIFNYVNNRFVYILTFCVLSSVAFYLSDGEGKPSAKSVNACVKGGASAVALLLNLGAWAYLEYASGTLSLPVKCVFALCSTALLSASGFALRALYGVNFFSLRSVRLLSHKRLLYAFVAVTLCFSFAHNIVYSEQFDDGTYYDSMRSEAEAYVAARTEESGEFFRLDKSNHVAWRDCNNRSLNNGYRGTVMYNTMVSSEISDFSDANNLVSFTPSLGMTGLNGRTALEALLCAKYCIVEDGAYVPSGYTKVQGFENLYETDNYVRFGSVFSHTASSGEIESLPACERQFAMLGAVVRDENAAEYSHVPFCRETAPDATDFSLEPGESIAVHAASLRGETYVGFSVSEVRQRESFTVKSKDTHVSKMICPKGDQMYYEQGNFLFKMGDDIESVEFCNNGAERLSFSAVSFYAADSERVAEAIASASGLDCLTDTEFRPDGFGGKINSDGGAMLIQTAYSKGWTAYVDGMQTEVYRSDFGLMSIDVPSGEHTIEFKYVTPLYKSGVIVSVLSAAALSVTAVIFIFKKSKLISCCRKGTL